MFSLFHSDNDMFTFLNYVNVFYRLTFTCIVTFTIVFDYLVLISKMKLTGNNWNFESMHFCDGKTTSEIKNYVVIECSRQS